MCLKAELMQDQHADRRIMAAATPLEAMYIGKNLKVDQKEWEAYALEKFETGLEAKFRQNPELKERLRATSGLTLHEASGSDGHWGIKCNLHSADLGDESKMPGKNVLGKMLMAIRRKFNPPIPMDDMEENDNFY
jgi:hypothetical protein